MTITEAIGARRSVRTFTGTPLTAEQRAAIIHAISHLKSPFGGKVTVQLVDADGKSEFRPSTYGIIRRAPAYLLIGHADDDASQIAAGYLLERVVLLAQQMRLGTCWVGGTFRHDTFATVAPMKEATPLRMVIPIGEPAKGKSFLDRLTSTIVKSSSRKPMDEMFFSESVLYSVASDSPFRQPLEMVRLAPSSRNSQPWRAIVDGNHVDFFCAGSARFNLVDMGIALCHFHLVCEELGLKVTLAPARPTSTAAPGATSPPSPSNSLTLDYSSTR